MEHLNSTLLFALLLILATLLCALVAGLLFAFAVVTMPGIRRLSDREFIRAFQVMDDVIQKNQPIFMLVWLGSAALMLVATVWGYKPIRCGRESPNCSRRGTVYPGCSGADGADKRTSEQQTANAGC